MKYFITGLQFLTRLHFVRETEWSPENFGKSVKYFPAVGAVLGSVLATVAFLILQLGEQYGFHISQNVFAIVILTLLVLLTGGLLCDGLMDTADGLFSGRSRERMLEIMKDSRVGANGVMAFTLLALLKYTLFAELVANHSIITALFVTPIVSRLAMVAGITLFPYARPEGIGKAFAQYATKRSFGFALLLTLLFTFPFGLMGFCALLASLMTAWICGSYITARLGGLTGDTYGALTEIAEIVVLFIFLWM